MKKMTQEYQGLENKVIEEMNRLGMIVDLSHAGRQTCLDAISFSKKPVTISHANPNFFHQSIRNIDDEVLKAVGKKITAL